MRAGAAVSSWPSPPSVPTRAVPADSRWTDGAFPPSPPPPEGPVLKTNVSRDAAAPVFAEKRTSVSFFYHFIFLVFLPSAVQPRTFRDVSAPDDSNQGNGAAPSVFLM